MVWIDREKIALKMIWLWTFVNLTKSQRAQQNMQYQEYNIGPTQPGIHVQLPPEMDTTQTIKVMWINSTTSSIAINWTFADHYRPNGSLSGSKIEYFVKNGRFTSDVFPSNVHEYILDNLQADTTYTICVHMTESDPSVISHVGLKSHSMCLNIATIPYVRKDSVLALLLTLGYFCFMGGLGYSQWRRKLVYIRKKYRRDETNLSRTNSTSRWINLQERVKLNNTCSIEDAVLL